MPQIRPSVTGIASVCAETQAPASGLVVFGASGDLTRRKLIVNIYKLFERDLLTEKFYLLGCGRKKLSDEDFRAIAKDAVIAGTTQVDQEKLNTLIERCYFISGDYDGPELYEGIKQRLEKLDEKHDVSQCHVFYLAVPPVLYGTIADQLGNAKLSKDYCGRCGRDPRVVVEKPFGRDLRTAAELNEQMQRNFNESQIYRIDHYLGKETIQNILMFSFANAIFEPLWNRNYVDNVQITIAKSIA